MVFFYVVHFLIDIVNLVLIVTTFLKKFSNHFRQPREQAQYIFLMESLNATVI